jgi:2'-hydroxyisoflavone reductase
MNLLILGGTVFLGRHVAREALARGHRVTLFHRGRHALEPGALGERSGTLDVVTGDRHDGFGALGTRTFDAVVDTSAYVPSEVSAVAEALGSRTRHYTFVSSLSAYSDYSLAGLDEDSPIPAITDEQRTAGESLDREDPEQRPRFLELYGPLKAACELEAARYLPGKACVVRPGLIVGPNDPTDRFTYWPERAARGGEALAPGRPARPVQFVDVRDLAAWIVSLGEAGRIGTFNANGPAHELDMAALLAACARGAGGDVHWTWCDDAFLLEHGVAPWMGLPLWIPETDASMHGFMRVDCARARDAGLAFRPLEDTVRDTLAWVATRPAGEPRRAGLDAARERELLAAWHARRD